MKTLIIHDTTIINEGQRLRASIVIEGERIREIIPLGSPLPPSDETIDGSGLLCLPGVIDDQVHFREPGLTHKGDIASESSAALLGGVTSYMEMPNCIPQTTTIEAWEDKMKKAKDHSRANYAFYFGATNDNADLLRCIDLRYTPGVKVFMGASTGDMLVDNEDTLRRIFAESPTLIAIHSESEPIIRANKQKFVELYGEDPDIKYHPMIRSREACMESTRKAIALARETGARLHVLHLSTAEETELFDPDSITPLSEKKITAEVCVHHLWFADSDYETFGAKIKWNPAIKGANDRAMLRSAVTQRRIDVIATDHAPHTLEEKQGGAMKAASGGPLVQFSLPMMLELSVQEKILDVEQVVEYMCHRPAELFGVVDRGYVREGYYADLVLVDMNAEYTIDKDMIRSKCGWSPLEGTTLHCRVVTTILNGNPVVRNGVIDELAANAVSRPLEFRPRSK